ncbi:hypothetical protein ACIQPR_02460, partial [Streptomyces sp. NPDC091280]|uniref:hypothetical protein n=1 Tax=Streptomyces sp. NPDC091280 TaxID=3365984 RepID=UPI00381476AA
VAKLQKMRNASLFALPTTGLALAGGATSILGEVAKLQKMRNASLFALPTTGLALAGGATSILGEVAKLQQASLRLGLRKSLVDFNTASSQSYATTAFQLASLARITAPFATGFTPLGSTGTLSATPVISSALKLKDLYAGRPPFSEPATQMSVDAVSVVDPESVHITAQNLLADKEAASELANLVKAFIDQTSEAGRTTEEPADRFSPKSIAPGALFLGALVFLFGTAVDVIGALEPSLTATLDRQFMYVSFGMATVYFLYQEGKR